VCFTARPQSRLAKEGVLMAIKCMALIVAAALGGCVLQLPGHRYPVRGPLAAQTPIPIHEVPLSGVTTSATMSATPQDGGVWRGRWAAVRKDEPTASAMSGDRDRVYGQGFLVANVLGSAVFARAVLVGARGTTLNTAIDDPTPGDVADRTAIARDNHGNGFKLTF
jgi:hypothetical protein